MTIRTAAILIATLITAPLAASAQQVNIPVHVGQKVWVAGNDGWEMKGTVTRVTPEGIDVSGETNAKHFDVTDIWRISTPDSLWSGTLIGAGIGAVTALPGRTYRTSSAQASYAFSSVASYAVIGALFDRANEGKQVVYERPMAPNEPRPTDAQRVPRATPSSDSQIASEAVALPAMLGRTVTVTLQNGMQVDGIVARQSPQAIDVKGSNGVKHIEAAAVRHIVTPRASSRFRKIGGVYGVSSGILVGAMFGGDIGSMLAAGTFSGGICAGVGILLDHAAGGHKTIYEQARASEPVAVHVAPIITLSRAGISGSISWK
jgi:hypothetical protein